MKQYSLPALVVALIVLCSAVLFAWRQNGTASVSGYIFEEGTSTPIGNSDIHLTAMSGNRRTSQPVITVSSDKTGYFEFKDVPKATYYLRASKEGYVDQILGSPVPGQQYDPDAVFDLSAGQAKSGLVIRLMQSGTLRGKIVDNKIGIDSVEVILFQRAFDAWGRSTSKIVAGAETDSNGRYRLTGFVPGKYFLAAGTSARALGGGSALKRAYQTSVPGISDKQYLWRFYPDQENLDSAMMVDVRANEEQELKDLILQQATAARSIHVHLIDDSTGQAPPKRGSYIGIMPRGWFTKSMGWFPLFQADGEFETTDVVPGVYWVSSYYLPNAAPGYAAGWALEVADVREKDATIQLRLIDRITISGRVTVDGSSNEPAPDLEGISIGFLFPKAEDAVITLDQKIYVETNEKGAFQYQGILPGDYRVIVDALPPTLYLKDIRFPDRSVLNQPISVRGKIAEPLSVILGPNAGQVDGRVLLPDGKAAARTTVVIVPDRDRDHAYLFQDTQSGSNGTFRLEGIAPGDYRLFAWDHIEKYSWFDPEVLQRYESKGVPVHVEEGSHPNIQLVVISN